MRQEDVILIEQARKNREKFGPLYEKYKDAVYAYCWKRVDHQKEIAEDITEETFTRALENLDRFQPTGDSYLGYLTTIAHNAIVNYYRSKKPVPLDELSESSVDSGEDVFEQVEIKQESETVLHALHHNLNKEGEELLHLRYEEGFSIKAIARRIHRSPNAVKLAISRYRRKLLNDPEVAPLNEERHHEPKKRPKQLDLDIR